jgi:hypothetical protein
MGLRMSLLCHQGILGKSISIDRSRCLGRKQMKNSKA